MQWGSDVDAVAALLEGVGPEDVIEDVLGTSGPEVPLWFNDLTVHKSPEYPFEIFLLTSSR
jgi:hypothetical protein